MPIQTPSTLSGFSSEDEHDLVSISPPDHSPRLTSRSVVPDTAPNSGSFDLDKHEIEHVDVDEKKPVIEAEEKLHPVHSCEKDQDKSIEEEVQRKMDETVRRVREQSDRIQAAARPYAQRTRDFAERKPVLFTYLAVFVALSFIPIACFVGFVVASTTFILGVAISGIIISILGVVLFGLSILLPILLFTATVSACILSFLLSLFLLHRLYLHLSISLSSGDTLDPNSPTSTSTSPEKHQPYHLDYANVSRGVQSWLEETKGRVGLEGVPLLPPQLRNPGNGNRIRWDANVDEKGSRGIGEGRWSVKTEEDGNDTDRTATGKTTFQRGVSSGTKL